MDAVTAAGRVPSLPRLSLDPAFRRGHGMICQGLAGGRVDEEALRDLLVRSYRFPGDPVIKGWAWQWLSQLGFGADSWTAPHDAVQAGRDDAASVTAAQILAHAARLRQAGDARPAVRDGRRI